MFFLVETTAAPTELVKDSKVTNDKKGTELLPEIERQLTLSTTRFGRTTESGFAQANS